MTEEEMRERAWQNAINCQGTYAVFARRLRRLKWRTKLRDFWAFAIPIIIGVIASSEALPFLTPHKQLLLGAVAIAALIQILIALWAIFSRWDDGVAYSLRAMRDAYEMKEAWSRIGRSEVADIALEYRIRSSQQAIIDSHDIQQEITNSEKRLGMRDGLIEFQRPCVCGEIPKARRVPIFPNKKCEICGGN